VNGARVLNCAATTPIPNNPSSHGLWGCVEETVQQKCGRQAEREREREAGRADETAPDRDQEQREDDVDLTLEPMLHIGPFKYSETPGSSCAQREVREHAERGVPSRDVMPTQRRGDVDQSDRQHERGRRRPASAGALGATRTRAARNVRSGWAADGQAQAIAEITMNATTASAVLQETGRAAQPRRGIAPG